MLVIARKAGEALRIGSDVEIVVLGVRGTGEQAVVRLGVSAPRSVSVARKEVVEAVSAENRRAAEQLSTDSLNLMSRVFKPEE